MPVDEILRGTVPDEPTFREIFSLDLIENRIHSEEENFLSLSLLSISISSGGSRSWKGRRRRRRRTYHRCPRWLEDEDTGEDACGYRWRRKGKKEGSKEEKRRERGRRAGGECWRQLPRCCRINFGGPQTQTVSVDSIERFYLRLSHSLRPFVPFSRFFLAGQSARFNRAEMFSGPAIFPLPRFPCSSANHRFDPSLKGVETIGRRLWFVL